MITAAVITNIVIAKGFYAAGVASWLVLGCHWFRGVASRLERGRRA